MGTIPRRDRKTNCYVKTIDFEFNTEVPQIVCETETCVEIGKKKIECLKDCDFEVCIPVKECCEREVRCELAMKRMKMQAKQRKNGTWDIYVLNNPDSGSPFHAGGMPRVWLIYHCLGADRLTTEFPGVSFAASRASQKEIKAVAAAKRPTTRQQSTPKQKAKARRTPPVQLSKA